jgi:hypothetical protein
VNQDQAMRFMLRSKERENQDRRNKESLQRNKGKRRNVSLVANFRRVVSFIKA